MSRLIESRTSAETFTNQQLAEVLERLVSDNSVFVLVRQGQVVIDEDTGTPKKMRQELTLKQLGVQRIEVRGLTQATVNQCDQYLILSFPDRQISLADFIKENPKIITFNRSELIRMIKQVIDQIHRDRKAVENFPSVETKKRKTTFLRNLRERYALYGGISIVVLLTLISIFNLHPSANSGEPTRLPQGSATTAAMETPLAVFSTPTTEATAVPTPIPPTETPTSTMTPIVTPTEGIPRDGYELTQYIMGRPELVEEAKAAFRAVTIDKEEFEQFARVNGGYAHRPRLSSTLDIAAEPQVYDIGTGYLFVSFGEASFGDFGVHDFLVHLKPTVNDSEEVEFETTRIVYYDLNFFGKKLAINLQTGLQLMFLKEGLYPQILVFDTDQTYFYVISLMDAFEGVVSLEGDQIKWASDQLMSTKSGLLISDEVGLSITRSPDSPYQITVAPEVEGLNSRDVLGYTQ